MPSPVEIQQAKRTIAKRLVADLLEHSELYWEDFPEIGEHDWTDIEALVAEWEAAPDDETFKRAYKLLADTAKENSGESDAD